MIASCNGCCTHRHSTSPSTCLSAPLTHGRCFEASQRVELSTFIFATAKACSTVSLEKCKTFSPDCSSGATRNTCSKEWQDPPAVRVSVLITLMNVWPTGGRFQQDGTGCKFRCGCALDRLEHYLFCPSLVQVAWAQFCLDLPGLPSPRLQHLLLRLRGPSCTRTACFIDCVRHAHRVVKHCSAARPESCVLARLKVLRLRHHQIREEWRQAEGDRPPAPLS